MIGYIDLLSAVLQYKNMHYNHPYSILFVVPIHNSNLKCSTDNELHRPNFYGAYFHNHIVDTYSLPEIALSGASKLASTCFTLFYRSVHVLYTEIHFIS